MQFGGLLTPSCGGWLASWIIGLFLGFGFLLGLLVADPLCGVGLPL